MLLLDPEPRSAREKINTTHKCPPIPIDSKHSFAFCKAKNQKEETRVLSPREVYSSVSWYCCCELPEKYPPSAPDSEPGPKRAPSAGTGGDGGTVLELEPMG